MSTLVTLNIRRTVGVAPAFSEDVDLDTLTPKARALAEAIHASVGHRPIGVLCATGLTKGDRPNFRYLYGDDPELAAEPDNRFVTNWGTLRADSVTSAQEWLERNAHGLGPDIYPIAGAKSRVEAREDRVPTADAAATDRCLSRDDARSRLAQQHDLVVSPNLWSRLMKIGHLPAPLHYAAGGRLPLWHVGDIDAYGRRGYEKWTISQVADHLGYSGPSATGSARKQLSRWEVGPIGRAPGRTGENLYAADQVQALHAARPGKGRHGATRSENGTFTSSK